MKKTLSKPKRLLMFAVSCLMFITAILAFKGQYYADVGFASTRISFQRGEGAGMTLALALFILTSIVLHGLTQTIGRRAARVALHIAWAFPFLIFWPIPFDASIETPGFYADGQAMYDDLTKQRIWGQIGRFGYIPFWEKAQYVDRDAQTTDYAADSDIREDAHGGAVAGWSTYYTWVGDDSGRSGYECPTRKTYYLGNFFLWHEAESELVDAAKNGQPKPALLTARCSRIPRPKGLGEAGPY